MSAQAVRRTRRKRAGSSAPNGTTSSMRNMPAAEPMCSQTGRLCAYQLVQAGSGCVW